MGRSCRYRRTYKNLANWTEYKGGRGEVPFKPARVILQDFTGVPSVLDLASMRMAMAEYAKATAGSGSGEEEEAWRTEKYVKTINPEVPVDLVIDHSVQVDYYGTPEALEKMSERNLKGTRNGTSS